MSGSDSEVNPADTGKDGSAGPAQNIKLTDKLTTMNREGLGENGVFPGMDYLGTGYDLLKGNPEGDPNTSIDPGFRPPVVQLHWDQSDDYLTRDWRELQPVEGWAMPETSCNQASSATSSSTMDDYEKELSVEVGVSAGYDGGVGSAAFSASVGSESFEKNVAQQDKERFEMKSFCLKYKAGLNKGPTANIRPTPYFAERLLELPRLPKNSCSNNQHCGAIFNLGLQKYVHFQIEVSAVCYGLLWGWSMCFAARTDGTTSTVQLDRTRPSAFAVCSRPWCGLILFSFVSLFACYLSTTCILLYLIRLGT